VRIESVQEDQRQVWVLTKRGHGEAKKLLEPKGIRISALREEKYDPDTGELLVTSYDDHAAAVTSTAAELHRAGIGHRLGFATEVPHRLAGGYVQRADLVVRAPEAGVPVLLLEIDRRTEVAHDLVAKLRRYWEKPTELNRLTPARVRRGFRSLHVKTGSPAGAPKPSRPGPGRPPGSKNRRPATRHDVGRVLATGEAFSRPTHHKVGTKPRRVGKMTSSASSPRLAR
jgi:hypothetical protein